MFAAKKQLRILILFYSKIKLKNLLFPLNLEKNEIIYFYTLQF